MMLVWFSTEITFTMDANCTSSTIRALSGRIAAIFWLGVLAVLLCLTLDPGSLSKEER